MTKEEVLKALSTVIDPDLNQDLVTLGMIQDIEIKKDKLTFSVVLTTPACPLKEMLRKECEQAIISKFGDNITLDIDMTSNVTSAINESPLISNFKNIVAVASGKGGVGKSTITANLAVALARTGASVGLIDADIFGPSMPVMFNCENEQPGVIQKDGKNMIVPVEQYGVKMMSIGFLTPPESAVVWRGPMASSAMKQFITDTDWGDLDYLLIDLPPGTSDIHLTLVQTVPLTGAVIITTPQRVALADAIKGLEMFRQEAINVPVLGLVENMSWFTPEELPDNKYYIFGKEGGKQLAESKGVPFLGQIPLVQSIRESSDDGYPAIMKDDVTSATFENLATSLARQIAIRNATIEKTRVVEMNT
ncbi:Mrp/NBP35 family ATP-binding protein [Bacteroidota bacterium]